MKKLIKEYLQLCIYSKKSLRKDIKRLDKVIEQLYEITARQEILFDEYSKKSYKVKWKKEHDKLKEIEKQINKKEVQNEQEYKG